MGYAVEACRDHMTDTEPKVQIRSGAKGIVLKIDDEGDVEIDWEHVPNIVWTLKENVERNLCRREGKCSLCRFYVLYIITSLDIGGVHFVFSSTIARVGGLVVSNVYK